MVLLNGVKYACERCIRGHRVSSCSHTDKPLIMIKPKGRPASQCTHCREQRKIKNAHVLCNCGKKGKSPGQHLASCPCNKNSHCTCVCVVKDKKQLPTLGAKKRSPSEPTSLDSAGSDVGRMDSLVPPVAASGANQELYFLIEDIALPFDTDGGLLEYFSPLKLLDTERFDDHARGDQAKHLEFEPTQRLNPVSHERHTNETHKADFRSNKTAATEGFKGSYGHPTHGDMLGHQLQSQRLREMNYFPHPPSDADLDLMENMFPLFPLVGFNSFEDNKSLPLLGLTQQNAQMNGGQGSNESASSASRVISSSERPDAQNFNRSGSVQCSSTSGHFALHSENQSSASLTNMSVGVTQHPRPMRASTSFNVGYLASRPKRSESVISAASTSSNTSKQNLFETPNIGQHQFPKTPSSAAYPPFDLMGNNSNDDFHQMGVHSLSYFNENRLLPILSDEELSKSGQLSGNVTPQSSIPSRQLLQNRRKTSLSRSHLQLHHNTAPKEHLFFPVKAGSSPENSPRQVLDRHHEVNDLDTYLREVAEEMTSFDLTNYQAMQSAANEGSGTQQDCASNNKNNSNNTYNLEHPEFSMIPMYQELFERM